MGNILNRLCVGTSQLSPVHTASDHLQQARLHQQNGNRDVARQAYDTAIHLAEAEMRHDAFNQAKEDALLNLYLEYAIFLNKYEQNTDKVRALYSAAVQKAEAKQERYPDDPQEKAALLKIYRDWSNILVACGLQKEASNLSQRIHALNLTAVPASTPWQQLPIATPTLPTREKSALIDRLFEKALSTLASLKIPNKPSLFLVYAHNNPACGKARAEEAKYFIENLSSIRAPLYSDQAPMGPTYLSLPEELKADGKLEDILTNQLCLLPAKLREDVVLVDKVIVCCSEVLGNYLAWPHYPAFYQALHQAYREDLEQRSTVAIRKVVRRFSNEELYQSGFHHVLTEMAFLQIRAEARPDEHGIIPVSLTPNSYHACLAHFIPATTVRIEDLNRLEKQEVYANQGRHGVLFKLIERLLISSDEAKTFLDKFWSGYSKLIARLKAIPDALTPLTYDQLVDDIFNDIRTVLLNQLARTVQESQATQRQALQANAEPLAILGKNVEQFKQAYQENLRGTGELDVLSMYVPVQGIKNGAQGEEPVDLEQELERFFASEASVFLLQGVAGSGKSTFNRHLALEKLKGYRHLAQTANDPPLVFFIELRSIENPNKQVIEQFLQSKGFTAEQIEALRTHTHQRCIFIFDGYDEIKERNRNFYELNELWRWEKAKFVITSRPEYLDANYQPYFRPKTAPQAFWETWMSPFSSEQRSRYIAHYVEKTKPLWNVEQYERAFNQLTPLGKELERPVVLRMLLQILPELEVNPQYAKGLTLGAVYEQYFQHWWGNWQARLGAIPLTEDEAKAKQELAERKGGFTPQGFTYIQNCALALTKSGLTIAQDNEKFEKQYADVYKAFFEEGPKARLLRFNAPFQIKQKQYYAFSHKSMQEYLMARAICAPEFEEINPHPTDELNQLSLANEPVILDFLVEQVKAQPSFKDYLVAWLEISKQADAPVTVGAANAMTILVRAGIQFNGADLKNIRIPGADLSFGVFDSAQLQGADLKEVNLRRIWLRQANLSGAQMAGVRFGEWPFLQEDSGVTTCVYLPDGKTCAVVLANGSISLYETSNWKKVHTLGGYTDEVQSGVYSPNGQQIASCGDDKTVRLRDAQSGQLSHTLRGHTSEVYSVVYSPNGQQIASCSWDETVRLWDAQSGQLSHTLSGHTIWFNSVVYSPNSQQIACGSDTHTRLLWSGQIADFSYPLRGPTSSVWSVVYSPNSQQIATCSRDYTVRLWDAQSGQLSHTLRGHTRSIDSVVYSPNGQQIASGSEDSTVRLWDAQSGQLGYTLRGHTHWVTSVVYSPNGQQIASCSSDNTVRLWDAQSGQLSHTLRGHTDSVWGVVYSPNGQQIASRSGDKTVRLWGAQSGQLSHTLSGHTYDVNSVVYSPNGQQIASCSWDKTVRLWDAQSAQPSHTLSGHTYNVNSVVYSPNGQQIASSSSDQTVRLWDAQSGQLSHTLRGHTDSVWGVVYSPNGQQIASGSSDETVRLWDAQSGQLSHTLRGHTNDILNGLNVVYSPDGQQIASASNDNTVRLWDAQSGQLSQTLRGHTAHVLSVVYSPDGQQIATGGFDHTVRLWDAQTGQLSHTLRGHTEIVRRVVYSPNSQQIASCSNGKTVQLWNAQTGQLSHTLRGHTDSVRSVVYSPNRQQIASCSADKTVRLWDARSAQLSHILHGHTDEVESVVYSPNGQQIASCSRDNTVRLWNVTSGGCDAVIQDFRKPVNSLVWKAAPDGNYLVTGCNDKSVRQWQVIKEGEEYKVVLCWSATHDVLTLTGASIEGVQGLSPLNEQLLKQRGAVGEPEAPRLAQTGKQVMNVAAAVSQFKAPLPRTTLDTLSSVNPSSPAKKQPLLSNLA